MDYGNIIDGSVGTGGANKAENVRLVQRLLNDARAREGGQQLKVDGVAGPLTNAAILQYQRAHALEADGRVDRGGRTLKQLVDAHLASLQAGVIAPYLVRGALDTVPSLDKDTIASVVHDYFSSLRS